MIPRFLLFVVLPLSLVYLIYHSFSKAVLKCRRCEGQGYWKGARGESNRCDACGGKGY